MHGLATTPSELTVALAALAQANAKLEQEKAERERVEAELRLSHRLEAVGQLAAGVAHEINTPIQFVGDSAHFLRTAFEDLQPVLACVQAFVEDLHGHRAAQRGAELARAWEVADASFITEHIPPAIRRTLDGIDRVAAIVRAMKAFAHPGSEQMSPADINDALTTTIAVCRNEYKYVADLETRFADLPLLSCHVGELNQVFLNLLVNASHAVAERIEGTAGRGLITVQTSLDGRFAVVRITDSGVGIAPELREKIFDPFFTTKPVGKGTGQGLTLARSIIVRHGGTLTFESELGKQTTFEIRLPLPDEPGASGLP